MPNKKHIIEQIDVLTLPFIYNDKNSEKKLLLNLEEQEKGNLIWVINI